MQICNTKRGGRHTVQIMYLSHILLYMYIYWSCILDDFFFGFWSSLMSYSWLVKCQSCLSTVDQCIWRRSSDACELRRHLVPEHVSNNSWRLNYRRKDDIPHHDSLLSYLNGLLFARHSLNNVVSLRGSGMTYKWCFGTRGVTVLFQDV